MNEVKNVIVLFDYAHCTEEEYIKVWNKLALAKPNCLVIPSPQNYFKKELDLYDTSQFNLNDDVDYNFVYRLCTIERTYSTGGKKLFVFYSHDKKIKEVIPPIDTENRFSRGV